MNSKQFGYSDMVGAWIFGAVSFGGGFGLGAILNRMKDEVARTFPILISPQCHRPA
jgi:hypothetical protein